MEARRRTTAVPTTNVVPTHLGTPADPGARVLTPSTQPKFSSDRRVIFAVGMQN